MEWITLTPENIETEHICCAFSNHNIFYRGQFITQHILTEKSFDRFIDW